MELGKAEPFRILNHHNCSVRHIDADFDYSSGDENLDLIPPESLHDLVFFLLLHLAVKAFHVDRTAQFFRKHPGIVRYVLCLQAFALLDHGADHIALSSLCDLPPHKCIGFLAVACIYNTVFDGQTVFRELVHHGDVKVAVKDDCQGTGDRGCAHYENMGHGALAGKCFSLFYPESVLLIRDHKSKVMIGDFLLNQGMGADDDGDFP